MVRLRIRFHGNIQEPQRLIDKRDTEVTRQTSIEKSFFDNAACKQCTIGRNAFFMRETGCCDQIGGGYAIIGQKRDFQRRAARV
jgi:hypothetical protein